MPTKVPPKPRPKPFTVDPLSPEAMEYGRNYGVDPQSLGNVIKETILDYQKSGKPYWGDLHNRPLAALGAHGMSVSDLLMTPMKELGSGANYIPEQLKGSSEFTKHVKDTINLLGENQRFIDDYIVVPGGFYIDNENKRKVRHELIHKAFKELRDIEGETEGRVAPKYSLKKPGYKSFPESREFGEEGLKEEDVVQLLDYIAGEDKGNAEWYFDKSPTWRYYTDVFGNFRRDEKGNRIRRKFPTTPERLLERPEVVELLMNVQKFAVDELRKRNVQSSVKFQDVLRRNMPSMGGVTIPIGEK